MTEHPPTTAHNYLAKIQALYAAAGIAAGSMSIARVLHDDWCDVHDMTAAGFCNCDPEIVLENEVKDS